MMLRLSIRILLLGCAVLCHAAGMCVVAAAGGAMGLQPNPLQQQQLITHDLQALLANPAMLSAAITGAQQGNAAAAASMGFGSQALGMQMGLPAAGAQLQIPSGPVPGAAAAAAGAMPPGGAGYAFPAAAPPQMPQPPPGFAGFGMAGGEFAMPGQQQPQGGGGFGGLMALQQQQSGFADEADDPYDPEHAD
jgi:hypothetical protein